MANFEKELKLAVLIDADNAPRTALPDIMREVTVYGTPVIRRIYGDWTDNTMNSWKAPLLEHAFIPVQQYGYTTGKNSTDCAMIIDAMDILYTGNCDGFVLVSSDSDFTRLALRLREAGKKVYGVGEKKTPQPFIVACDKFVYIEIIKATAKQAAKAKKAAEKAAKLTTEAPKTQSKTTKKAEEAPIDKVDIAPDPVLPNELVTFIAGAIESLASEDGSVNLAQLGNHFLKLRPDFDPRNYGFSKLSKLITASRRFSLETHGDNTTTFYVRDNEG